MQLHLHAQSYNSNKHPTAIWLFEKGFHFLRGRQSLEGGGDLLLPSQLGLAEDLGGRLEALALVQETSAQDDLVVAKSSLVVVGVGGAVGAVVAVHRLARLAGVGVGLEVVAAGGEGQGALGDDLVEGEGATREVFASVAVAMEELAEGAHEEFNGVLGIEEQRTKECGWPGLARA